MRRAAAALVAVGALAMPGAVTPATAAETAFELSHGGLQRAYLVHVPAGLDRSRAAPLLVALHGGGGHMHLQADERFYGLKSLAEREGWIVAFPNGYSRMPGGRLATWNAGDCCGSARDAGSDDVGFIAAMVERIAAQWPIDRRRIFATGMSNGAMMAYRLACERPDLFSAIAAVAGTDNTRHCAPDRAVSVLHIHARDDDHVQFGGGAGPSAVRAALITDFKSVPATMARWAQLNGCSAPPRTVFEQPGGDGARCELQDACRDGARVQLCVTETGGHSWPGGRKPRSRMPTSSQALSANAVIGDFLAGRRMP